MTSINGTSYIGAWTTIIVRDGNDLQIKMKEKNPIIQCAKGGPLSASVILKLEEYAAASAADGGKGVEKTLHLEVSGDGSRITKVLDDALAGTASAAEKIGEAVDTAAIAAKKATAGVAATSKTETDIEAAVQEPTDASQTSKAAAERLYSAGDLQLRAYIKVIPYDRWVAQDGSFEINGGALEQTVAALPSPLHSYAHGGFMGLACTILGDPEWSTILKEESDIAWNALQREQLKLKALSKADKPNLAQGNYMMVLENSPVLCAYGLVRTACTTPAATSAVSGGDAVPAAAVTPIGLKSTARVTSSDLEAPTDQIMDASATPDGAQKAAKRAAVTAAAAAAKAAAVKKSLEALKQYQTSMATPNIYGYKPLAMEWDIWVSPRHPAALEEATVNHGTKAALVTQAILTAVPGLKGCAQRAGTNQILDEGLPPVDWLTQLGHSINRAVNGNKESPLPLAGPEDSCWKVHVQFNQISGLSPHKWVSTHVVVDADSYDVVLPSEKTVMSKDHKIKYDGKMIEAYKFIGIFKHVKKINYEGEILYNVLMEEYETIRVNNFICETLHPNNPIAKMYRFYKTKNQHQKKKKLIKK